MIDGELVFINVNKSGLCQNMRWVHLTKSTRSPRGVVMGPEVV
jgi:hypothetical protein